MVRARTDRRFVHPGAWWLWAACGAVTALRTTNPLLLGLLLAVVAFVVVSRRSDAPWARTFSAALRLGVLVIVIRLAFQILFGNRLPGTTLFAVPSVDLPAWAGGVSLGGEVTLEALVGAFYQGFRLAVVIACFAAASSLCSPYRLLRSLPSVLYEAGVAVSVALTTAPQAVVSARQVRDARRLRGRGGRGLTVLRDVALPVLEGALERSIALAASMDARGYGRRGDASVGARRVAATLTLAGLLLAAVGSYGVLDPSTPFVLGVPALAVGMASLAAALVAGSRRSARTRYRPDPWAGPEWATAASGLIMVLGVVAAGRAGADLEPSVQPLEWPTLPVLAALGLLAGLLPAWLTPLPPSLATVDDLPPAERTPATTPCRPDPADPAAADQGAAGSGGPERGTFGPAVADPSPAGATPATGDRSSATQLPDPGPLAEAAP
ncbi:energy-coupling factor transporter transmembrane component T [Rhabdothermincola salaria]|uniref:energy-coupling factor transporter transmembrane component T n=1 Tax=Rhabdothermincola salaria TaxID=2903142 RepID=UPI001E527F15|nr:energy-coupling factor transporter transmembrane component T [Rhabdothermincola salaria]MCD9623869.1 energy-coupling factor transporter transmembrane protein EcfT [Rhabdothermincola salaria]